ncbi:MAG: response regulator transcription factor [Bacteroidia bacterium]|nr:response regulator transcription factor [Bacteroidia bacterium]MCO5252983.1 LytTR family DNA-binding domain-containing protein [Bacteroidota bacterium]
MKIIRCIAIDDEPLALQLVESYIKKTPFLELVGVFSTPLDALRVLDYESIDLIYLDIQMPDISGIDFSKNINSNIRVIFTTAFGEYALDAYKANAIDYLLKPFNYNDFLNASLKAKEWFDLISMKQSPKSEPMLFVKSGYNNVQIKLSEITYFQGFKDYIKIFTDNNPSPILTLMTMKSLMDTLPKEQFIRVHRSYIVPVNKIKNSDRGHVWVRNHKIPISDSYKETFAKFIATRAIR